MTDHLPDATKMVLFPAAQAVLVSERPWEREGWCDDEGRCWLGGDQLASGSPSWILGYHAWASRFPDVHYCCLPFNALPIPPSNDN